MKKFIFAAAVLMGFTAHAKIQPEDVFETIFDLIQDQIAKDKGDNEPQPGNGWNGGHGGNWNGGGDFNWKDQNKVILQDVGNKIILGRVFLDDVGMDTVNFPKCINSGNQRVTDLRFTVDEADVYIESIKITYQNNQSEIFEIEDVMNDGEKSPWFNLAGGADRCIKRIRVIGEVVVNQGPVGGWNGGWSGGGQWNKNSNFGFGFGNSNGGISFGPGIGPKPGPGHGGGFPGGPGHGGPGGFPGGPGHGPGFPGGGFNDTAVVNFIGQKG